MKTEAIIKTRKILLLAIAASLAFAGATRAQEIARPKILGIAHAALLCSDIAASERFYKEILGCAEIWRGSRDGKELNYINLRLYE